MCCMFTKLTKITCLNTIDVLRKIRCTHSHTTKAIYIYLHVGKKGGSIDQTNKAQKEQTKTSRETERSKQGNADVV